MAIVINFIANAGQYIRGVQDAINTTDIFSRRTADALRANAAEFAKWGAAASAAGAVGAAAMIASAANTASELTKLATMASLSTEELQRQAFAASKAGVDLETYASTIKDMNDRVGDFVQAGSGPLVDFFEKIGPKVGVTAENFKELSGPDALQLYVSSLEKANVSQADMTFYMEAIAGDSTALLPLLANNGEAMKEFANEADRLGIVLSDLDVIALDDMGSSVEDLVTMFKAFSDQFSAEFAPVVQVVAELLREAAVEAGGVGNAAEAAFDKTIDAAVFVVNAIDGIGRTFQLAGSFIAQSAAMVVHDVLWIAESIVSGPIEAINDLIRLTNSITGLNISTFEQPEFVEGMRREMELAKGVVREASLDMQEILMRPMAGDTFRGMVDAAKKAAEESAQAALDIKNEEIQQKKKLRDEEAAIEKGFTEEDQKTRLDILRSTIESEKGLLGAKYAQELEQINAFYEGKKALEAEWNEIILAKNEQFKAALTAIDQKQADEQKRIAEESAQAKAQAVDTFYSDAASLMSAGSKRLQKIGQAAAIVDAVRHGWGAAVKAWEAGMSTGGPFAPAVAAAYTAASLAKTGAMIQSIRSGSSSGGGGGGSGVGAIPQTTPPASTFSVDVNGLNPGQLFSGSDIGTNLIGLINDRLRAGDRLVGINV